MQTETYGGVATSAVQRSRRERERALVTVVALGLAIVLGVAGCASLQADLPGVPATSLLRPYYGPPYGWR
jgi:hypothetical protein